MARKALARAISSSLALSIFNSGDLSLLRGRGARAFDDDGDLLMDMHTSISLRVMVVDVGVMVVGMVVVVHVVLCGGGGRLVSPHKLCGDSKKCLIVQVVLNASQGQGVMTVL